MTLRSVGLVARQELRTRIRTGRWKVLLAVWAVVVNGLALVFRASLTTLDGPAAVPMFGGVMMTVLVLTLLIAPALTAQTINGERERGTLAVLQVTRLTPGEIVLGKLAAGWSVGLVILGLTLPSALLPVLEGAVSPLHMVSVLLVVALLMGIVLALSLGWSAIVSRSITSVMLSYLTVLGLLVATPVVFMMALPLTEYGSYRDRPDTIWWLLAPNPVVILADAAPALDRKPVYRYSSHTQEYYVDGYTNEEDIMGDLAKEVRQLRVDSRRGMDSGYERSKDEGAPVWPWGLAFNTLLAAGALYTATRRLRTPVEHPPQGVRLA